MKHPEVLGVILARGNSRSIPRKNILSLAGKPLIAYTIEAAQKAQRLDRLILSTDSPEIAEVARALGAEVPFMRPAELARDGTLSVHSLRHALQWMQENEGCSPEYVLLLQPTSPFRTAADIDRSIELAVEKDADTVVSFTRARQHPYWMTRITDEGRLEDFPDLEPKYLRRQSLPPFYYPVGSIYLAKSRLVMKQDSFFTDKTYAYLVPVERSLDIDTPLDFRMAELLLKEGVALPSNTPVNASRS